jgi:hypothetical protein
MSISLGIGLKMLLIFPKRPRIFAAHEEVHGVFMSIPDVLFLDIEVSEFDGFADFFAAKRKQSPNLQPSFLPGMTGIVMHFNRLEPVGRDLEMCKSRFEGRLRVLSHRPAGGYE